MLFNCGTTVLPPEPAGVLLLYFDDPSELCNEADDPGAALDFGEPSLDSSLELDFEAKGFKLLNQLPRAGEAAESIAPSTKISGPMAFTPANVAGSLRVPFAEPPSDCKPHPLPVAAHGACLLP